MERTNNGLNIRREGRFNVCKLQNMEQMSTIRVGNFEMTHTQVKWRFLLYHIDKNINKIEKKENDLN